MTLREYIKHRFNIRKHGKAAIKNGTPMRPEDTVYGRELAEKEDSKAIKKQIKAVDKANKSKK